MAHLCPECRAACRPLQPIVDAEGVRVGAVEILARRTAFMPLIVVVPAIPADAWQDVQPSCRGVQAQCPHPAFVALPLVAAGTAIKRVGFERFEGISQLGINFRAAARGDASLAEDACRLERAVVRSPIAT